MELLFFLIWSSICLYLVWRHGHKSAWGKLHFKQTIPISSDMTLISPGFVGYVNIDILQNEKRTGGWAINLYVNNQGMLFNSIKYFRYFMPSFYIPWSDLSAIEQNNTQGFMRHRMTKLVLINSDIDVLIPPGTFTNTFLAYIKESAIIYGR